MKLRKSMQIALCGLLGAIMVVTMLLGSIFPLTTILCPAIAGLFFIPVVRECGLSSTLILYITVSILSLLLIPDKEAALLYVLLLGPYPLVRPLFNRIPFQPIQILVKLVFCNILVAVVYALLLFIIAPAAFVSEFSAYTTATLLVLLGMTNLAFLLYDLCLNRISFLYEYKLRNQIFRNQTFL